MLSELIVTVGSVHGGGPLTLNDGLSIGTIVVSVAIGAPGMVLGYMSIKDRRARREQVRLAAIAKEKQDELDGITRQILAKVEETLHTSHQAAEQLRPSNGTSVARMVESLRLNMLEVTQYLVEQAERAETERQKLGLDPVPPPKFTPPLTGHSPLIQ